MQAQFIFTSGNAAIANVEKVKVTTSPLDGKITKLEWTTPDDAYAELRYIDAKQVAAIVLLHDIPEDDDTVRAAL